MSVPFAVARDLCVPELRSGGRELKHRTVVPVPETPVDEDRGPETGEHHIGTTEKLAIVQAETESTCMQAAAQQQFGFRVLAANMAHVEPTLRRSQDIRHSALYYTRWCPNRIYGFDACARRFSFVFAKSHVACPEGLKLRWGVP